MKKLTAFCYLLFCFVFVQCQKDTFQNNVGAPSNSIPKSLSVAQAQEWFTKKYGETKSVNFHRGERSLVDITPIWAFAKEEASRGIPVVIVPIIPKEELENGNRAKAFLSFFYNGDDIIDVKLIYSIGDASYTDGSKEKTPESFSGIIVKYNLEGEMLKYSPLLKDGKLIGFLDSTIIQPNVGKLGKVSIIDSSQIVWVNTFFEDPVFMQALPELHDVLSLYLPIGGDTHNVPGGGTGGSTGGAPSTYGGGGSSAGTNGGGYIPQEGTILGLGIIPPNDPYFMHHAVLDFSTNPFQSINQYLANNGYQFQMTFDEAQLAFIANHAELINPFYVFLTFHNNQLSKDYAQMVVDFIAEQDVLAEGQYYAQEMDLLEAAQGVISFLGTHSPLSQEDLSLIANHFEALTTNSEYCEANEQLNYPEIGTENWANTLDLSPDQNQEYSSLTQQEKALCKTWPGAALEMQSNATDAQLETILRFGVNGHNEQSDAFRHAFFNAINSASQNIGLTLAKQFADAHESENPIELIKETEMDFWNNHKGRTIASLHLDASDDELSNLVMSAYVTGELRYLSPLNWTLSPLFPQGLNGIISSTILIPTP